MDSSLSHGSPGDPGRFSLVQNTSEVVRAKGIDSGGDNEGVLVLISIVQAVNEYYQCAYSQVRALRGGYSTLRARTASPSVIIFCLIIIPLMPKY